MKRLMALLFAAALLLTACAEKVPNIVFEGVIEEVYENGFLVTTTDLDGTDKVSIGYDKNMKPLDFTPAPGQTVEMTILPELRESYPVQATAVQVTLKEDVGAADAAESTGVAPKEDDIVITDEEMEKLLRSVVPVKITADEAKSLMDGDGDAVILDVRTQEEFDEGHIEGALLLPDTEVADKAQDILPDKDATILVYCRSGRRSALAADELVQLGYTDVRDFGGIIDWPYETVK